MQALDAVQIAAWAKGRWFRAPAPACVQGICMDSRSVKPGDMFIALRTGKRDGHEFLQMAESNGAAAALVERESMATGLPQLIVSDTLEALHLIASGIRTQFKGRIAAITGSCGKTSTKNLLALLLGEGVLATEGNLNNYIGMPLTLCRLRAGHRAAVVELGISLKGEMEPLARILRPDLAIVTSVAPAHLEGMGSLAGVAEEKAALPGVMGRNGYAYFPAYCLQWEPYRELRCKVRVTASMDEDTPELPGANYSLVRYQTFHSPDAGRSDMLLYRGGEENFCRFTLPRLSLGMRSNAALALSVALDMGESEEALRERLPLWKPASMRGEIRSLGAVDYCVDCYNANPASMLDSVRLFRESYPRGPRLFLFGSMNELGVEAAALHWKLGREIGAEAQDRFCLVGPHAQALCGGLLEAGVLARSICVAASMDEARAVLDTFRQGSGAALIKGSRSYQLEELLPPELSQQASHQC